MIRPFFRRAGALSAGMIAVGAALQPFPASAGPEEDAFFGAGYNQCDARLIAVYWGSSDLAGIIEDAGDKIIRGNKDQVDEHLAGGRQKNNGNRALCPAADFYSPNEIAAYADYWDIGKSQAQDEISDKLLMGEKYAIDDAIRDELGG